jgi:hypothetical protein
MMDSDRRTILTTGAAVAATAAVPQVFAQQGGQEGGATSFYKKSNVVRKSKARIFRGAHGIEVFSTVKFLKHNPSA